MHYITLDTNTWIYLANGTEPVRILDYIRQEVEKNNITILLPAIIVTEWEDHKDRTVRQGVMRQYKEVEEAMEQILRLLGDKGERDRFSFLLEQQDNNNDFKAFIQNFKEKKNQIEKAIGDNIALIDELFKTKAVVIQSGDKVFVKCGQFALEKKAPFKMKNSFADALIIFTLFDYLKTNQIEDALFISYNTGDYCEKKDKTKLLHPELKQEFDDARCQYFKIVGEAINTIKQDIITNEEIAFIREMQEEDEDDKIVFCQVCSENNDKFATVYFGRPVNLMDERTPIRDIRADAGLFDSTVQNELFGTRLKPSYSKIEVGHCDWCNSEHFKCVDCGSVNPVWDEEYNKKKECEGCGQLYVIKREYDRKGNEEIQYTIPAEMVICQKCSQEFDPSDMIESLCKACEDEYSYG